MFKSLQLPFINVSGFETMTVSIKTEKIKKELR